MNEIGGRRAEQQVGVGGAAHVEVENFEAIHGAIRVRPAAPEMHIGDAKRSAADLYWLAFLLTGRGEINIDIAADGAVSMADVNPFFAGWMRAWSRRIVMAKALAAIRDELAKSARRTKLASVPLCAGPAARPLSPDASKADIEEALLAIDTFPRAAVVLLTLENVPIADAATLLDADASLVRKAQAIGLREFMTNLGQKRGYQLLTKVADWIRATQCVALRKCPRSFLYFRYAQRASDRSSCRIGG